ncbi:MAG: hypothetical protein GC158_06440 [Cyanobacteria bacterium RI_101]|nr:hypothetical protein [Cyanobacteria bacterium RI_101]
MSLFAGQVWQDLNADGVQDPGELGLGGITVYLDLNGNQLLDADEPQRLTDAAGAYSFDNLDNGLYSIRLLAPSNTTLILPQVQTPAISLRGLDADGRGVALWDALAGAPEPERTGHDIVFNGAVIDSAYYYLASRDYLNPTAPAGIQGQGEIIGFSNLTAALSAGGYTAADLTVQFGLASLGADLEGEDWFAEGTRETRLYQGGELTLQLAGEDFLRAAFPTLTTLINYNDPLNVDDDRLSAWSAGFTLEDNSLGSSLEIQSIAQAFLSDAASQGELRLVFDSFQSADQVEFNENGREGAVFDAQFGRLGFVEDVGVQEDGYLIVLDGSKTLDALDFGLAPLATTTYEGYFFTYNYGNGDSYTGVVYELAGTYSAGEVIDGFSNSTGNEGFYTIDSVFEVDSAIEGEVFIDGYIDGDIGYGAVNSFFGGGDFGLGSESGTVNDFLGFDFSPLVEGDALEPLSISGNVSEDTTNDGVGDVNLSGVTIELLSAGAVLTSALTDFDGNYVFPNLAPGTYTVRQTNLPNYQDISDSDGGDPNEITATLAPGQINSGNNFIDEQPFSALDLAQAILGAGVDLISATYVGDNRGATVFDNPGLGIEIPSGIVLSTGNVANIVGPNQSDSIGTNFPTSGDADLDNLVSPNTTNDAAVLEFSFVPTEEFLSFNYIFASEEYNEFVDSNFNDVFGFFLIDSLGNQRNLAVLPDTDIPITVNNINGSVNSSFYRNNDPSDFGVGLTPFNTEFDGLTTALTAVANVTPGQTYTLKLAIADTSDSGYDSAVFLSNGSFSSTSLVAVNDAATLIAASSTVINVLVNDLVPTSGSPQILSFQTLSDQGGIIALDDNGTTETSSDDQLVYTAPAGFVGTDTFTYTLGDGSGASDTAQVSLQVEAAPGATLSGAVLKDLDGDGLGDLGIGAVQVELFDALGSGPLAVTFTDAVGNYSFFLPSGQDSGTYIVRQTNLAGYEDVSDSDGGDPNEITIVVEPNGAYGGNDFIDQLIPSSLQIQLNLLTDNGGAPGELISANQLTVGQTFFVEILAADLRDNAQGIIGLELDLVWDGLLLEAINFDPTTAVTPNFTVIQGGTLDNGLGTLSGLVGASAPAFGEGAAIGVNQLERFALLRFQAEAVSGGAQNLTTTLVSAALADDGTFTPEVETEQPFEVLPPPTGSISGAVLEDIDNDGIGDSGIAGVTVGLLFNGAIIATQATDELGNYLFADFDPGVYVVQQINLPGYSDVSDSDGGDLNEITVTLAPGQINSGNDFIDEQLGEISGQVFEDIDGDGFGDLGLAGVTVTLLQNGGIVASAVTDTNGAYVFSGLATGIYAVQQTNLSGYSDVSDSDGGDLNVITVTLAPGGNSEANDFIDALTPVYDQYAFTYAYPSGDSYTGSVYALEGTYTPGQVLTLSGVPGTYTIGEILSTTPDSALEGTVILTAYTDASTGFGTTANVTGVSFGGLGSESGQAIATPFNPFQEADLGFGAITITDNFGDSADQIIRFTTPLSQFRGNYADSDLVRPNAPDTGKYFDILNSGDGILRVSDITVNAPGVSVDLDFSGGDILLNPGASQRVNLTYDPGAAGESLSGAVTVFSDAQNNPAIGVILAGRSTFNADINYDGVVNIADLGALNQAKFQEILGNFDPTADINGDGALTTQDIFSWLAEL